MAYNLPEHIDTRPIAVIGAGTLGSRIALMMATQGAEIRIFDPKKEARTKAVEFVTSELPDQVAATEGGESGTVIASETLEDALKDVWLVFEAAPEDVEIKRDMFGQLDQLAPADAILASNSSSFPTSDFIDNVKQPERVLNTHFMMPPEINSVELMSDGQTDPRIIDLLMKTFPRYGLTPYHVMAESVGFIFNRIWAAIKRESLSVVEEGVSTPETVDKIFQQNFGSAQGPFRMMDKVGLDIVLNIEEHYAKVRDGLPEGPRKLLRKMVDDERLGVKSGQGFYTDYAN